MSFLVENRGEKLPFGFATLVLEKHNVVCNFVLFLRFKDDAICALAFEVALSLS